LQGESIGDAELLVATAHGDAQAFGNLVRRHIRAATLLAVQLLGDQDDAEDVVQVAFNLVYERANIFDTKREFSPWLFGIVRRLALNKRARDVRRNRLLKLWGRTTDSSSGVASATDSVVGARLDIEQVMRRLKELPPMQRACFELVALRGIDIAEAAAMHGIAEATVRQHVFRARRTLSTDVENTTPDDNVYAGDTETP
jgi:RNA polymerase sigma-70 factor (ECF subfamily)